MQKIKFDIYYRFQLAMFVLFYMPLIFFLGGYVLQSTVIASPNNTVVKVVNDTAQIQIQQQPLGQVDLSAVFPDSYVHSLGFTDKGDFIFADIKELLENTGQIVLWDIHKQKIISRLPLTKQIYANGLKLSPDGKVLVTRETPLYAQSGRTHQVKIIGAADLKVLKTVDLVKGNRITDFFFLNDDKEHIIVTMASRISYGDDFIDGDHRFAWLNISTNKVDKNLAYSHARATKELTRSSNKKDLLCLFPNTEDPQDQTGILDVIDSTTGKILWHIEGNEKQSVGYPLFFISSTRFISSDTVFDIKTKTAHQWAVINPSRRFVAEVPGHSAYAIFLTDNGTELRNWKTDRLIKSWPTLKEQGHLSFSPDLKIMAYQRDQTVQFWKFDPAWLK